MKPATRKSVKKKRSVRDSTVKRAAALKKLTKTGGRKKMEAKKRLAQSGATGQEW
jgi:hypothetical protein